MLGASISNKELMVYSLSKSFKEKESYKQWLILCVNICRPYSVEDLQVIDLEFFNSLKYVLENDPEPLALMFAIEEQSFGVVGVAVANFNSCVYIRGCGYRLQSMN